MRVVVIWLLFVFFLSGNTLRAATAETLFDDPHLSQAEKLINSGNFAEALSLLRRVAPGHPQALDAYFLWGLSALEVADRTADDSKRNALLEESIVIWHDILVVHPNFHRARLELARAFFLKGDDELAKENFERVLAIAPDTQAAARINQFLAVIRARRRWDGYFSLAIAPDSNINSATEAREVYFSGFPFPFQLSDNSRRRSGLGALITGGGEYRFPLSKKTQWRTGIDITRSDYSGGNYDQTVVGFYAGPRFLMSPQTMWSVLATGSQRWVAGNRYSREFGARLEATRRFTRRLIANATTSWSRRSHRQGTSSNGPNTSHRLGASYYFSPTILVNGYAEIFRARPRERSIRYRGHKINGGVQWTLAKGWTVGGNIDRSFTFHKGAALGTNGAARKDKVLKASAYVLNRSLTIGGFSPQFSIVRENGQSNATLARYNRHRGEIRFIRQF